MVRSWVSLFQSLGHKARRQLYLFVLLGTRVECMYQLMTYGIPCDPFPLTTEGRIDTKFHVQLWEKRRLHERNSHHIVHVAVPSRKDVLSGTGKRVQMHIGNVRYRKLVEDCYETYDNGTVAQKKQITEEIVDIIKTSGGRFLKDDGMGWREVEDEIARQKVSGVFRNVRKVTKNKKSCRNPRVPSRDLP